MKSLIIFGLFILCCTQVWSQEICNNGIDDDNDFLIDLNDTVDCQCSGIPGAVVNIPSLIPNPSFEQMSCCPSSYSQMNCATGWVQASMATSDYMNHCGFVNGAIATGGLSNFPDGNGIVGAIFLPGYQEYVGSCLSQPMLGGKSYTLQFSIASNPVDGQGNSCSGGNIYYGPVDITIFGSGSCANLPFAGTACPSAPAWNIIGHTNYTPVSAWHIITITFVPPFDMNAIIFGAPCALPSTYNGGSGNCEPYFYYDNLILNTTKSFSPISIKQNGAVCKNDVVLNSHSDTSGGTWQWYRNGIALVGQTDSTLNVSSNNFGTGHFTAIYSLGGNCETVSDSVLADFPSVTITNHTDEVCDGNHDGSATALATGGSGLLSYHWDSSPAQINQNAVFLPQGHYIVTVNDTLGCTDTASVTINSLHQKYFVPNIQSVCSGDGYSINSHTYFTSGIYYDTLNTVFGCDSIVVTQLSNFPSYYIVNPQSICQGEVYTINTHTYFLPGIYNDTLSTIEGCDSVIATEIIHALSYTIQNPHTICHGENYEIGANNYAATGHYVDTLNTIDGCDSIIITDLIVNPVFLVDNFQSICVGDSYQFNSNVYNEIGNYHDTLQAVSGCDSIIETQLTVKPLPVLTFNHPQDLCIDVPYLNLTHAIPSGGLYSGEGVSNNIFYPANAGEGNHALIYSYTDPLTQCSNEATESINVNSLPVVQFTVNPKVMFLANANVNFVDYTSNAGNWEWNFGDSLNSDLRNGIHVFRDTGYFQIDLIVVDNNGCRNKSTDQIYVGLEFAFHIPNAFTPNKDGHNESFNGVGIGIGKYKMNIFDRWGKEVFKTDNIYCSWDGDDAPADTYIYKVNLEDITGQPYEYVGHVSLIR